MGVGVEVGVSVGVEVGVSVGVELGLAVGLGSSVGSEPCEKPGPSSVPVVASSSVVGPPVAVPWVAFLAGAPPSVC